MTSHRNIALAAKMAAASVLGLACASSSGASAKASLQVSFVVVEVCAVRSSDSAGPPRIACIAATPHRVSAMSTGPQPSGWTVYF